MKILVVRFSSIGDIVLTTPVVRSIKKQIPGAEIYYLTKTENQDLVKHNPYITKTLLLRDSLSETIAELKNESFKEVIDLHHNLRTFRLKLSLNAPVHPFPKLNLEKWLMVNFKWNRLPEVHVVDRYFNAIRHLGIINDQEGLDFFFPPDFSFGPSAFGLKTGEYIACCIGGKFSTKKMPAEKIASIVSGLKKPVILLGGEGDMEAGDNITKRSVNPQTINACGKTSLFESAAMIRDSYKCMTHDTGMMHIAAALGKPILSVWGNTIPAFGMAPYYGKTKPKSFISEVSGLACRPCSKIGFKGCPAGHFQCMENQAIEPIQEFLNTD